MDIAVRGIVQTAENGHNHVAVVVTEGAPYLVKTQQMGVDVKVSKGKILTFLSELYGITPGKIVWPDHIRLKDDDD